MTIRSQAFKLISYEHWANQKIIEALAACDSLPPRANELISHVLAVSSIWLSRAKGDAEVAKRFDMYDLETCTKLNDRMQSEWNNYLDSLQYFDEQYMTFLFLGKQSRMAVMDCINHVVMHGNYHRGQIVLLLKEHLPELPMTDYVLFALSEN